MLSSRCEEIPRARFRKSPEKPLQEVLSDLEPDEIVILLGAVTAFGYLYHIEMNSVFRCASGLSP